MPRNDVTCPVVTRNNNSPGTGTTQPTRAGRSGGGASDAARSFGKPQVAGEAQGSPSAGRHGFENWRLLKRKRRRKESSWVATMISRVVGTPTFSDRTEFSVCTAGPHVQKPRPFPI